MVISSRPVTWAGPKHRLGYVHRRHHPERREGSGRTRAEPPFCTGTVSSVRAGGSAQNGQFWPVGESVRATTGVPGLCPGRCYGGDPERGSAVCVVLGVVLDRLTLPPLPALRGERVTLRGPGNRMWMTRQTSGDAEPVIGVPCMIAWRRPGHLG